MRQDVKNCQTDSFTESSKIGLKSRDFVGDIDNFVRERALHALPVYFQLGLETSNLVLDVFEPLGYFLRCQLILPKLFI
jgi:hypothetical protein